MNERVTRRGVLGAASGIGVTALAGCLGDESETDDDRASSTDDDGQEAVGSDGLVYAFGLDQVSILDPDTGEVVDEITGEFEDVSWAEAQLTHDEQQLFAVEEELDQVHVFETATRTHETTIDVGQGANHAHHPTDDEIWVHADGEGTFYVIDTDELEVTELVEAGLEGDGHGKLLHHEALGETAYATNVDDPGLAVIDLDAYERTDFIEFGDPGGTHYKAYSPQNDLAYAEYFGGTTVVDTDEQAVVDELDVAGGMYLSPDASILAIVDDDVHFIDVTDDENTELAALEIDGNPSSVRYDPEGEYAFVITTEDDELVVIDTDELAETDRLDIGGSDSRNRMAVTGGGYLITPATVDESVAVVDTDTLNVDLIDLGGPVETVQYVGDSGPGYTGGIR